RCGRAGPRIAATRWESRRSIRPWQEALRQLHPEGRAVGQRLVIEVVAGTVQADPAALAGAVAEIDVTAGFRLQHEGKILRTHHRRRLGADIVGSDHLGSDFGGDSDVRRVVDERWIAPFVAQARTAAEGRGDVLANCAHALFDLVLDLRQEAADGTP